MLVVDLHTLHTVYVLYFVDDVLLNGSRTHDVEDVGGSDSTVGEGCAGTNDVVLLHKNLLRQRHEILLGIAELGSDSDFAVAALDFSEVDLTVDFRNDSGIRRVAGLEEFGDTGKTAGDIAGTVCGAGDLCECVADLDFVAFLEDEVCADREGVCCEYFAVFSDNLHRGHMLTVARLDDDAVFSHGVTFGVVAECHILDKVDIVDLTCFLGYDDVVEGVPFADFVAGLDIVAVVHEELRTVSYLSAHELETGIVVDDTHFGKTSDNNLNTVLAFDCAELLDFETSVVLRDEL